MITKPSFAGESDKRFEKDAPYYVELSGETTEKAQTADDTEAPRSARRRRQRMTAEYREWIQEGREIVQVKLKTLREAVDRYPCVILLGEPGCGKTTALNHLAYELANVPELLPVTLHLSEFEPGMNVEDFIVNGWAGSEGSGHWNAPVLADNLEDYLDAGKLYLLFDALNEMPQKEYADRARALRTFINKWSPQGNHFLVTCRVLDYGEELSGLQRVEIQPLGDEQIKDFLHRELPSDGEALWQELTKGGNSQRSLLEMARNPYILTIMIDVFAEDGDLGRNRSELMKRFTEILIEWSRSKTSPERLLHADIMHESLSQMAFEIKRQVGFGTLVEIDLVKSVISQQLHTDPDPVLDQAAGAHIIVMPVDRSSVRFYHQLLQEYFAACEMLKREPGNLTDLWLWPWLETEMPSWKKRPDPFLGGIMILCRHRLPPTGKRLPSWQPG